MFPLLLVSAMMVTWLSSCDCSSLSLVIAPQRQDCLFMEKDRNDKIACDIQIPSGQKVSVRLLLPNKSEWKFYKDIRALEINEIATEIGDYGFCFLNSNSYREEAVVQFDYDLHEEDMDNESRFKKQLSNEKKHYIKEHLRKLQPKIAQGLGGIAETKTEVVEDDLEMNTISQVKESLMILSLQMDRMDYFLKRHTAKMTYQHYVQKENKDLVTFFSTFISVVIVLVACLQVVILKGFINGKRTWKFWKF